VNLPFQVIGSHSRTATVILATTLAVLATRSEEDAQLETLVLDHLSDTSLLKLCHNPMDLINMIRVFQGLRNLVISIKRQEASTSSQANFTQSLWFLIRKASFLDSLCLIGWNIKRNMVTRRFSHGVSLTSWNMRSLPSPRDGLRGLENLRFLELRRVDIAPHSLLNIIKLASQSLKELFLNEVYLKINRWENDIKCNLWIGLPSIQKPADSCWLAEEIRDMEGLKLDIIKATGLGYDEFEPLVASDLPDYDLNDPTLRGRSFDCRFVETALGIADDTTITNATTTIEFDESAEARLQTPPNNNINSCVADWDSDTFQRHHNTTSHFRRCIDGYFFNKNEGALKELQKVITVADRGMTLLTEEIDRTRGGEAPLVIGETT
jgi:hypothetical protein